MFRNIHLEQCRQLKFGTLYCLSDMEEKAVCQVVSILSLYICLIKQQINCILAIFTLGANVSVYSKYTLGVKFGILVFFFFHLSFYISYGNTCNS